MTIQVTISRKEVIAMHATGNQRGAVNTERISSNILYSLVWIFLRKKKILLIFFFSLRNSPCLCDCMAVVAINKIIFDMERSDKIFASYLSPHPSQTTKTFCHVERIDWEREREKECVCVCVRSPTSPQLNRGKKGWILWCQRSEIRVGDSVHVCTFALSF